jgi:hypothetical protein
MAWELKRGWIPHDEGALGQSAERVLQGEIPHRDFDEIYTGGLDYLNAAAFRLLGTNLVSMRYMVYLFFLAWVPAVFYVAARFVSPPLAGAVALLAVAWSLPNYAAAMPSWYNLFFATFGLAAILRYIEDENRAWLFAAGLCGGISFLFKLSGMYFVAGAILFLFFREQLANTAKPTSRTENFWFRAFLIASVFSYEALVLAIVVKSLSATALLYFFVPVFTIGAAILWQEFRGAGNRGQRFAFLFRELAAFGVGVALPIAIFLVPYFLAGGLRAFVRGVFVLPARRFIYESLKPTLLRSGAGIAANLALVGGAFLTPAKARRIVGGILLLGVPLGLILARVKPAAYKIAWSAIWTLLPVVVVSGVWLLARWLRMNKIENPKPQQLFLILAVTAACNVIQLPFSAAVYFCFVAPLVILATTAVVSQVRQPPRLVLFAVYCFCLFYVVFEVTPGFVYVMGQEYSRDTQTAGLTLPRARGLRISATGAKQYEELATLLGQHVRGQYIYATPDCPEIYFLYGFRNQTRSISDFFVFDDPIGRTERILLLIQARNINLVVLNRDPGFSLPLPSDLRAALEREFAGHTDVGKFEVRWKP